MQHDLTLTRGAITLRPLRPVDDAPRLFASWDADLWGGMSAPFPTTEDEQIAYHQALVDSPTVQMFAVERDGVPVGQTGYLDRLPPVRTDIGYTVYAREVWASEVNPTAKFLLFEYAFETLGVNRVGIRCDARNTRSARAIERLGARYEGTLRSMRPASDGTLADMRYYSVLADEWDAVRAGLLARLG